MKDFYKGKKILVTGHTGFKGVWLCRMLLHLGADVTGYALTPATAPSLFELSRMDRHMASVIGDVRDYNELQRAVDACRPEIVFHLAAQPIVRESYNNPLYTYETNVLGTVNLLECIRRQDSVRSFVNVTTDKVYDNKGLDRAYNEDDILDGYDPYSNSKSCSELATHCYKRSFFYDRALSVSTARAGNVIGGGDFAIDRIIPDCVRAAVEGRNIIVRNPNSVRPYQHVLDPLMAYLLIGWKQFGKPEYQGSYNVGPDDSDCISTGRLTDIFCEKWGDDISWTDGHDGGPHEAKLLKLDCRLIKEKINWKPKWNIEKSIEEVVSWTKGYISGADIGTITDEQIKEFIG